MTNDPWTRHIPEGIVIGAVSHTGIRVHCPACEWDAVYPCIDLRGLVVIATEHVTNHKHTGQ